MSTENEPAPSPTVETAPTPSPTPTTAPTEAPSLINKDAPVVETKAPEVVPPVEFVPLIPTDIKFAEGLTVPDEVRDSLLGIMNNQELSPQQRAQALVDLHTSLSQATSEASSTAWATVQEEWVKEVKADPDLGGANLDGNLSKISGLIDQYGSPELRSAFDITGAGNNPHVLRFLVKVAGDLSEGRPANGTPAGGASPEAAQSRMFPSMKN